MGPEANQIDEADGRGMHLRLTDKTPKKTDDAGHTHQTPALDTHGETR